MQGIVRYNKIRSELSKFVKANDVKLAKGSFNELNKETFRSTKDQPLSEVINNIDVFVDERIRPDEEFDVIPESNWFHIKDETNGYGIDQRIVVDNSHAIEGGTYFDGLLGDFLQTDFWQEINSSYKRDPENYPVYVFKLSKDENGNSVLYAVLVDREEIESGEFDIDDYLEGEPEIEYEPEPPKEEPDEIKIERAKKETLQAQVELEKEKQETIQSIFDKTQKLLEQGFSPEQIAKLFGL